MTNKKRSHCRVYRKIWNDNNPNDKVYPGDGYVIHHINGDSFDNRIENLQKMTDMEHRLLHTVGKKATDEAKEKMSKSRMGEKNHFYGKHHSEKTKKLLSEMNKGENHRYYGKTFSSAHKKKISESVKGNKNHNYKHIPLHGIWFMREHGMKMKDIANNFNVNVRTLYTKMKTPEYQAILQEAA